MRNVDIIIAGAGWWGSTLARRFAERGFKVLVLEKRGFVGGNARSEKDRETGIEIHRYGSHIFHTNLKNVWEFVNRFADFNAYRHKVLAMYRDQLFFLPIGLSLINKFFGLELTPDGAREVVSDQVRMEALLDAFVRGYTRKQWGISLEEIDSTVIKRLPVRTNYDVNYFDDRYQGVPLSGYGALFSRILDHANISVQCDCELRVENREYRVLGAEADAIGSILKRRPPVYYSGPLDFLFNYKFGCLTWRTLRFDLEKLDIRDYQGTAVVNYPEASFPYIRIHEFKHYHPEDVMTLGLAKTIIMREYSMPWKCGQEPFYPIVNVRSKQLYCKYMEEVAEIDGLVVGGRLGGYKYFNMDDTINAALELDVD